MKNTQKFSSLKAGVAPVVLGLALVAGPAFAQAGAPVEAVEEVGTGEEIVVTGSLITNPNLVQSSPVSTTSSEEIELLQSNVAEEVLREIPGVVPSIGSNVNNGNNGASFVNLRGLGSNRNLVLLDGARLTPANFNGSVDLNNIPLALLDRVDVLTGGASTTYGADAISGVVNFITKRDFAGIELNVSEQITEMGDGNQFRADLTIGANFDDGRGNAVFGVGYQESDPIYQGARDISIFQVNSASGLAAGGSPTGIPTAIELNNGSFVQIAPDGQSLAPFYNEFNFNPFNVFQTPFERFNMFGQARYEVSDSVEVYTRGLFSKNTVNTIIAPSGIFGEALTVRSDNPFLTPGIRAQLCADNGFAGCTATSTETFALPAVYRRTTEVGPRISEYTTTIFDYKAGLIFNITDGIGLDVSGAYGESENREARQNYVLRSRVQQALNATNTTTCTVTTNGCVPLNIFGVAGSITEAQAGFIRGLSTITNKSSLAQARAVLSGDLGFASPFGEDGISFALGGEYRDYRAAREPDSLAAVPGELGGAGGAITPLRGGFDVYEAFGELNIPLVQDRPFFHSLTLEAGVRYSAYQVDAVGSPKFNATTYKFGGSWEPVESLKFRGNYQKAVRAPNIGELFAAVSTGLTNLSDDPCASIGLGTPPPVIRPAPTGNLAAICLAQGAPALAVASGTIQQPAAGQANSTGGGNPNVGPEKAKTYTFGAVFQPDFVPGLSISIDYYNIKVTGAITSPTPGDVISACFGATPLTPPAGAAATAACTSIRRNPVNGRLSGSPATTPGLPVPLSNLGRLSTSGIDLIANYRTDMEFATLNLSFAGNWTEKSKFQATPSSVNRECTSFYSVNCGSLQPEFSFSQRTTLGFDGIDVSLLWRYIDGFTYEPGLPARFNGTITGSGPLVGTTANFNKIDSYNYFDLSGRFSVTDNLTLTLTVMNLLDKAAPLVGNTIGNTGFNSGNTFPSTYDALGRKYAAAVKLKF